MVNAGTFDHAHFSPVPSIVGGLFLGTFAFSFLVLVGRPLGVSGMMRSALLQFSQKEKTGSMEFGIRVSFVLGLLISGVVAAALHPHLLQTVPKSPNVTPKLGGDWFWYTRYLVGGLLVGLGTCMSNGCTTGHGLSGLSRFSIRSFVAVGSFMGSAIALGTAINTSKDFPKPADDFAVASPDKSMSAYIVLGVALAALAAVFSPSLVSTSVEDFRTRTARVYAAVFVCAFGVGSSLVLGGMALPSKIAGFLDFRNWDPSLAFLMAGAHAIMMPLTLLLVEPRMKAGTPPPLCLRNEDASCHGNAANCGWSIRGINTKLVDRQLVGGSIIFGFGWALSAACPGPAVLRLAAFDSAAHGSWPAVHSLCLSVGWLACFALGSYVTSSTACSANSGTSAASEAGSAPADLESGDGSSPFKLKQTRASDSGPETSSRSASLSFHLPNGSFRTVPDVSTPIVVSNSDVHYPPLNMPASAGSSAVAPATSHGSQLVSPHPSSPTRSDSSRSFLLKLGSSRSLFSRQDA